MSYLVTSSWLYQYSGNAILQYLRNAPYSRRYYCALRGHRVEKG